MDFFAWTLPLGWLGPLSHQEDWRAQLEGVSEQRASISCMQHGLHGPPFHAVLSGHSMWRAAGRWLPWNWASLDGTGWCYESNWDQIYRCEELDGHADWNGVAGGMPADPAIFFGSIVLGLFSGTLMVTYFAYFDWVALPSRLVHVEAQQPLQAASVIQWIRGGNGWPWRWEKPWTRWALIACIATPALAWSIPI